MAFPDTEWTQRMDDQLTGLAGSPSHQRPVIFPSADETAHTGETDLPTDANMSLPLGGFGMFW